MTENLIEAKSKAFALRIVKAYKYLQGKNELVMGKQLLRAGTSIGANVAEGQFAQSRADFVLKYSIALKEASETRYWLELLQKAGCLPNSASTRSLVSECSELIRLLVASLKTAKNNKL